MKIIDHGFLTAVESWGSEERIIEAARMSTDKGFLGWDPGPCPHCAGTGKSDEGVDCLTCEGKGKHAGDQRLLSYLYSKHHDTPFEMAGLIIEVQAPIFVFREWHRHRTQSYNELSARYTPMPNLNYVPTIERLLMHLAGGQNKQAGTVKKSKLLSPSMADEFQRELAQMYEGQELFYQKWLAEGVSKELARIDLPVGRYSRMRASANLRNWLAFMTLRTDPAAQWEIRQYAAAVEAIIATAFPRTHALFVARRNEPAVLSLREARIAELERQLGELKGKPTLILDEPDRQLVLKCLASMSVERPGWETALHSLALQIDNQSDGRAQMFDQFRLLQKQP